MTKDEIIQMAEDCGIVHQYYEIPISRKGIVTVESQTGRLLKFAKLVAELERERLVFPPNFFGKSCARPLRKQSEQGVRNE
jgi:hypothetical protein